LIKDTSFFLFPLQDVMGAGAICTTGNIGTVFQVSNHTFYKNQSSYFSIPAGYAMIFKSGEMQF
jgi:hypothetical protein